MSHTPSPKKASAVFDQILLLAAILGSAYLLTQWLNINSFGHRTIFQFVHGEPPPRLGPLQEIDDVANQATKLAGDGNLLVSPDSVPTAVSILHPRAVYALWPRRLYAVSPGVVILDSAQIGPATRPNDPAWLKAHHVMASVKFGMTDNRLTVDRVDPISP